MVGLLKMRRRLRAQAIRVDRMLLIPLRSRGVE
jgi:hypothetical protein